VASPSRFCIVGHQKSENECLGVAPWTVVFSRLPRGPLSVLKETREVAIDPSVSLGKNASEYLRESRSRLESVRLYVQSHNANTQRQYVNRYNSRAREKHFQVGDLVLARYNVPSELQAALSPDSVSSRTFSRCPFTTQLCY